MLRLVSPSARGVLVPVIALALALPLAVTVLARQIELHRLDAEVARYERHEIATDRIETAVARAETCRTFCPDELGLLTAIARIDIAQQDPTARPRALPAALRSVRAVLAARPSWGPGLAVAAAAEQEAGRTPAAIGLFARSYAAAPYLRAQALWRLRFAAANWAALGETTRVAAMREAAWMAGLGWFDKQAVAQALGDSPAAVRFAILAAVPDAPSS